MKKLLILLVLFCVSGFCDAQENFGPDLWSPSVPYPKSTEIFFPEGVEHFVVQDCNQDPDYRFLHETAVGFLDNELILAWYNNIQKELEGKTFQRAKRSSDFGQTWTEPEIIIDKDNDLGLMYVGMQFLTLDGTLYLFTNLEHGAEYPVDCILMSWDSNSKNWKIVGPVAERFLAMQQPMLMDNGNFIMSGSYAPEADKKFASTPMVCISQGKEITKPWKQVRLDPENEVNLFAETGIVVDNQNILAVTRRENSPYPNFYESNDYGETWRKIENRTFPAVASKFAAGRLSNGYRYIVYNLPQFNRTADGKIDDASLQWYQRDTLVMAIAKPGEYAFSKLWKISNPDGATGLTTSHYPCLVEHDGWVYISYTGTLPDKQWRVAALTKFPLKSLEAEQPYASYVPWFAPFAQKGFTLTDWHIHIRGGMTPEKAFQRAIETGVRSGVLENHGRDWPLCNDQKLSEFIADVERVNETIADPAQKLKIGIQVNDRDWYRQISPEVRQKLDYILADTMIMDTDENGKPQKLWLLPKDHPVDPEAWMNRYMEHNLQILDEPINILANVTYLPSFVEDQYDKLWTEERMKAIIQKAIDRNIALEIQAESDFPKPKFIQLALKMGAKLSFGSNNFDDRLKKTDTWKNVFENFDLKPDQLLSNLKD